MKNILKMFRYIPGEKLRISGLILFSIFGGLVNAAIPLLLRGILDSISKALTTNSFTIVYWLLGMIIGLFLLDQIVMFFKEKVSDTFRMHIMTKLRLAIYPKILGLDIAYIEKHQPGSILQRINQAVGDFTNIIFSLSEWTGTLITSTFFILIVLWFQNIYIGILFTLIIPLLVFISIRKAKAQEPSMKTANKYMEKFYGTLSETLSHLETIKSLSAEKASTQKLRGLNIKLKNARLEQFKIQRQYNFVRDFLGAIGVSIGLIITIILVTRRQLSPGDVLLIVLYSRSLIGSIQPLGYLIQDASGVNITSERLIKFLETKPVFADSESAVKLSEIESVYFQAVTYDYPDGKKGAVKNLNFEIGAGKTVALVGPSGVGKSTLTKLLLRYYLPTSGAIEINKQPMEAFTADSIRQHIGVVMQDVALFNATIRENLQIADSDASMADIEKAARQAHAHEFIKELPKGYDTLVGERGIKLSGGQKQRVAIARAILKDPQLIILDEATSALDSESERLVQDGLRKLMAGRSALIIAHRLSTVMHADEILVLQKGTIVERGTHQQLMKYKGGLYRRLFEMQSATGKVEL